MPFSANRGDDSTVNADDPYEPTTLAEAALAMSVTSCDVIGVITMPPLFLRGPAHLVSASGARQREQRLEHLRRVLAQADMSEHGSPEDQDRVDAEAMQDLAPYRAEATLIAHRQADES